jgi:hypothetical protein
VQSSDLLYLPSLGHFLIFFFFLSAFSTDTSMRLFWPSACPLCSHDIPCMPHALAHCQTFVCFCFQ